LLRRLDEGAVVPFTRIVIEASGLADPAPVLQTLMTDAAIAERLVLGGVVTTVDAVNGAIARRFRQNRRPSLTACSRPSVLRPGFETPG
jgi:G3E family GTPase